MDDNNLKRCILQRNDETKVLFQLTLFLPFIYHIEIVTVTFQDERLCLSWSQFQSFISQASTEFSKSKRKLLWWCCLALLLELAVLLWSVARL